MFELNQSLLCTSSIFTLARQSFPIAHRARSRRDDSREGRFPSLFPFTDPAPKEWLKQWDNLENKHWYSMGPLKKVGHHSEPASIQLSHNRAILYPGAVAPRWTSARALWTRRGTDRARRLRTRTNGSEEGAAKKLLGFN